MIIQATRIAREGGIHYLARHLLDKPRENERIEILAGDRSALHDAHALATVKGCRYALRHWSISPECEMTPAQLSTFLKSIDAEFNVGTDRPRLIVRHVKDGRSHFHVAIAEVDPETLRVLDCRNDFRRLEDLARKYEQVHGETVQPSRAERRERKVEGLSDVARKRAERTAPEFDRTRLRRAAALGHSAFRQELGRQELRIGEGEKGPILVSASGAFVAAANRAVGMRRADFQKFLTEGHESEQTARTERRVPDHAGTNRHQPDPASAALVTVGGARRPGQDCAVVGTPRPHPGNPEPASRRAPTPRRETRSLTPSITRFREALFLHRLTKLDLDDLLRRALAFAASIRSMLEPETDRLARQIAETRKRRESFSPAEPIEPQGLTYSFRRRIT
ncbi:relaxase/mobilization nuclease domain-containing protein [Sinorhizobium fredii]|uniref:relaxase/mobilization nuclease domain-containing protein n=1 Tax=Rhizobium fredii TaxID=380 RepID=UPI00309AFC71